MHLARFPRARFAHLPTPYVGPPRCEDPRISTV